MLTPDPAQQREGRETLHFAYLCNVYPAVSHSFVRREIAAIERQGHQVSRFSIRPPHSDLPDADDRSELDKTEVVLSQGVLSLALHTLTFFVRHPVRYFRGLVAANQSRGPGFRRAALHFIYLAEAVWLCGRFARLQVDHVHAHFGTNPAAVAQLVTALGGPPYSFTAHGPDEFDAPVALALDKKTAASKFVAAISSFGRSQLMRWSAPADWHKIKVIRCGLDAAYLQAEATAAPDGSTEFVCVARLAPQKGLPLLVEACALLRDDGHDYSLLIIGDGELRRSLEDQVERLGLGTVVKFAGVRTGSEVREHLLGARAFVLPSFAEGLPVVLREALALSRPVITTSIAGIPELVDQSCGWLIPAGSENGLAKAIGAALDAPTAELLAKGKVGRERVLAMHDATRNAALIANYARPESSDLISNR